MGNGVLKSVPNGNVILIDPNLINTEDDGNLATNAIPQYQDMHIFAELTAESKGRTIITNGNANTTSSKSINFIGNNQNKEGNDPNYLNFTTNYYDGSTLENEIHYEGFGINSINMKINSSFIPQVNIQFVDIRGLAFFNQKDSPYRMLFDFPPPIFKLTIKGYYGKPITYRLHLVKYTSEFKSENGNFIIDAQFVAVTFAPLSDVLFRYVVNTPLIDNIKSLKPVTGTAPRNTFDLILKLKNLYANIGNTIKTDALTINYNKVLADISTIDEIFVILNNYNKNDVLLNGGEPHLMIRNPIETTLAPLVTDLYSERETIHINELRQYDEIIKSRESSSGISSTDNRLYVAYFVGVNLGWNGSTIIPKKNDVIYKFPTENSNTFASPLSSFKKTLLSYKLDSITYNDNTDIIKPQQFNGDVTPQNVIEKTVYYGIDITDYYIKIYQKRAELYKTRKELAAELTDKINKIVAAELGMKPSIYNIFQIILNDVDVFFSKLRKVSISASESHEKFKDLISSDGSFGENNKLKIYSFPLIINKVGEREERVSPIELNDKGVPFPELDFVKKFIQTFFDQKHYTEQLFKRDELGDDGEYKWIPISPVDSTLGGASPESPYLNVNDDVITQTQRTLLKRFYILSQGTIPNSIYTEPTTKEELVKNSLIVSNAYVRLYSEAEAINIGSAITSKNNASAIQIMANKYATNIDAFYSDIAELTDNYDNGTGTTTGNLYNFPTDDPKEFPATPSHPSVGNVYVDKNNPNFRGLEFDDMTNVEIRETTKVSINPVDNFANSVEDSSWFFKQNPKEFYFNFTKNNVLLFKDWGTASSTNIIENISTATRYLTRSVYEDADGSLNDKYPGNDGDNDWDRQMVAYDYGNKSFQYYRENVTKNILDMNNSILNVWSTILGRYDRQLIHELTQDSRLGSMLVLSNFGYTASPFNKYPLLLNDVIFSTPSAIEVPAFYGAYIGMLLNAIEFGWKENIISFFLGGQNGGSELPNRGFFVLADLHDVNLYLSEYDKLLFKLEYDNYMDNFPAIQSSFQTLYNRVNENIIDGIDNYYNVKSIMYGYYLNPLADVRKDLKNGTRGEFYIPLIKKHIIRKALINFSQLTFQMKNLSDYNTGYVSLKTLNEEKDFNNVKYKKNINDKFFKGLFNKLGEITGTAIEKFSDEEKLNEETKGDRDIINQLYYSFKNINDRWLTGTDGGAKNYPFNGAKENLIDLFAFVDRGMNPIGETIINAEILIDMLDDPNISLFTVLSQLLSLNGFEFFPLQNFLNFNDEESWKNSFKIHTNSIDTTENTFFVCMYVGGSSSYPSVSGNGFENDGIIDISEPGVKDFSTVKMTVEKLNQLRIVASTEEGKASLTENEKQYLINEFPWQEVRAFRVRFGEQNQSMFTGIKIDSKEYPETNESIQILSRLAGDGNPTVQTPKGQNLYNLYENRSYKATITGLGNAMIQPTQYFQLENIPLFNGAYIILEVNHSLTANQMNTTFSGTKLLKYPVPRVTSPVAFTPYDGQTAGEYLKQMIEPNATPNGTPISPNTLDTKFGYNKYLSMYSNNDNVLKLK